MSAKETLSKTNDSRLFDSFSENFNKIIELWTEELLLNEDIEAILIFGSDNPKTSLKKILTNYQEEKKLEENERKRNINVLMKSGIIELSDIKINEFNNTIQSILQYNEIPQRFYTRIPEHFAFMICVGFELLPKHKKGAVYVEKFRDYLEKPDGLEKKLRELKQNPNLDFLTKLHKDDDLADDTVDWRKRTKEKYERILLSRSLGKDIKSKTKYKNEFNKIQQEINEIKQKILSKYNLLN